MNLTQRSTLPEKMDDAHCSTQDVETALNELETVNRWLGGYAVIRNSFKNIPEKDPLNIIDIGCGSGDIIRDIATHLDKAGRVYQITGVDINPDTINLAAKRSMNFPHVKFENLNVWSEEIKKLRADVVMSSMFCHHFDDKELVELVKRMFDLAGMVVIINDLHRHPLAFHAIKYITAAFSKSHLVKYDAPLSVARALTKKEWIDILAKAQITNYTIEWKWAWRWQIIIRK
jgi:ubiquinone/menaquinone biosynthesis C-methylase UbiE